MRPQTTTFAMMDDLGDQDVIHVQMMILKVYVYILKN